MESNFQLNINDLPISQSQSWVNFLLDGLKSAQNSPVNQFVVAHQKLGTPSYAKSDFISFKGDLPGVFSPRLFLQKLMQICMPMVEKKGNELLLLMLHSKSGDHQLRLIGCFCINQVFFCTIQTVVVSLGFLNLPSTVVSATSFFDDAGGWKNSSKKSGDPPGFSLPEVCFLSDLCWSGKWVSHSIPKFGFTFYIIFFGGGSSFFQGLPKN